MKRIIEVCAGSYQDCLAAYRGGAQRAELNSALSVGGLTPSVAALRRAKQETSLKIICMVRPRAAGFCYDEADVQIMMDDARILLQEGADGIAFGFLDEHGRVAAEDTAAMCGLIHSFGKEAVFHRAFDVCEDPFAAMQTLIQCGADRLLTSGQQAKAVQGGRADPHAAGALRQRDRDPRRQRGQCGECPFAHGTDRDLAGAFLMQGSSMRSDDRKRTGQLCLSERPASMRS